MKKIILIFTVFTAASLFTHLFGQEKSFDFDFSVNLRNLDSALGELDPEKSVILTGAVNTRETGYDSPELYVGEIELIDSLWTVEEEIKIFKCIVLFEGEQYRKTILSGHPRRPSPDLIPLNADVLVIAVYNKEASEARGMPVFFGQYIRVID